jgi:hemerythrin-like domain-containing protein
MSAAYDYSLPVHAEHHDQVREWITQMRIASDFLYGDADAAQVRALAGFYRREVRPHFAYEERKLFPALRELEPDPELHARLDAFEREHLELLAGLDALVENLEAIASGALPGPRLDASSRRARLAIDLLLLHAAEEDDLLLPLIERHRGALAGI